MEPIDLEAASEEVQELLAAQPRWLVRHGIALVCGVVTLVLFATAFIRYPEILPGRLVITTRQPPVKIMARSSGRLEHLYVKDGQRVETGALLGIIENPADASEVMALAEWLRRTDSAALGRPEAAVPSFTHLGELQTPYSVLVRNAETLEYFRRADYQPQMVTGIRDQIREQGLVRERVQRQRDLAVKKAALMKAQYERQRVLFEQGLIPQSELMNAELVSLESRGIAEDLEARVAAGRSQASDYQNRLLDLQREMSQTQLDRESAAAESLKQLVSQLAAWEDRYALRAPVPGVVSFGQLWADHQFVQANGEVVTIVPDSGAPIGRITLPLSGAGKARPGQRVLVKLDDFFYQEFGSLEGVVEAISPVSRDGQYVVDVRFPSRLVTSYGTVIPPRAELNGSAEIVTDDVRLLARLLRPLRFAASRT
jgi:multidrug resistance efflux pump